MMMVEEKKSKTAQRAIEKERADIRADNLRVLESPMSVVKMDVSELKNFTNRVNDFLKGPDVVAIRICECCINVE